MYIFVGFLLGNDKNVTFAFFFQEHHEKKKEANFEAKLIVFVRI